VSYSSASQSRPLQQRWQSKGSSAPSYAGHLALAGYEPIVADILVKPLLLLLGEPSPLDGAVVPLDRVTVFALGAIGQFIRAAQCNA
jgi:hypothetical protein